MAQCVLEAEPYNIKCCFADRDFLCGKPITTSIEERLEQSMAAVFFLTPNFINSEFCKQEHLIAQQMAFIRESKFRIVPVLLQDCQMPARFECITYIDGRNKSPQELIEDERGLYYALTNGRWHHTVLVARTGTCRACYYKASFNPHASLRGAPQKVFCLN